MITLKINNRVVEVEEGSTILQAAKKLGIFIPTFCFDDFERMPAKHCSNCHEYGDCKMCSCEVEGEGSLLTACNTEAKDGMVVWTESLEVKKARRSILTRMIATHPLDCVNCKKLGSCKLQKYCEMYGVKDPEYVIPYEHREKDLSNRFYFQEMDKCIRCGKCVRTCRELVGVNALQMVQKGNVAYTNYSLFAPGSWLAKPVKTVLEVLPLFDGYSEFTALDLGCGVGRNCIPAAQRFREIPCRVDCVDILELAITRLTENARQYGVADCIRGIVSAIDDYEITADSYDLILAVSALEHIATQSAFEKKLIQIRDGLRPGGVACLIVNSGVVEHDKATGKEVPPQFEVNLPTDEMERLLQDAFDGWQIIKHTTVHQKYDIPRQWGISALETDVVTYVVRKVGKQHG